MPHSRTYPLKPANNPHQLSSDLVLKRQRDRAERERQRERERERDMVNWVEAQKPLLHWMMKMAGLAPESVEIDKGTVMNFWVPSKKQKEKSKGMKPAIVLVHGFAAEGIVTWQFQIGALTKKYDVYVPDLLFFGNSTTSSSDRSPTFQAECLVKALAIMDVDRFAVVGFSYGGMVAFKIAELHPELITALVISGSILAMTDSISETNLAQLGYSSSSDLLLPTDIKGLKALLSIATHKKLWFPDCLHRDYLKVMFTNRKERSELLEGLIISNRDPVIPSFPQSILLLWGENDQIFNIELAKNMKEQLGDKATLQSIPKAGHLVHLERPCVYNKHLKEFLALTLYQPQESQNQ